MINEAPEQGQQADLSVVENDFRAFEEYRRTGELPKPAEEPAEDKPPAAAEEQATNETDSGSEEQDTAEQEQSEEQKSKGKGFQKRIDKLTRKIHELESKLGQKPEVVKPAEGGSKNPDGKPLLKDFVDSGKYQTYEEAQQAHVEAFSDWKDARAAQSELQRERANVWKAREAETKAQHSDYAAVLEAADESVVFSPAAGEAIADSDLGPTLLYHLAKNPADAERIAKLSPVAQVRELGKLEQKLSTPTPQPKPKLTSAPDPITPVSRPAKPAAPDIYDADTQSDYKAWEKARAAQLKRK